MDDIRAFALNKGLRELSQPTEITSSAGAGDNPSHKQNIDFVFIEF